MGPLPFQKSPLRPPFSKGGVGEDFSEGLAKLGFMANFKIFVSAILKADRVLLNKAKICEAFPFLCVLCGLCERQSFFIPVDFSPGLS